jgi:hypothetical protein
MTITVRDKYEGTLDTKEITNADEIDITVEELADKYYGKWYDMVLSTKAGLLININEKDFARRNR